MVNWRLTCWDFEQAGLWQTRFCCENCHEDANLDDGSDYPLQEHTAPSRPHGPPAMSWASVCCQLGQQDILEQRRAWALVWKKKRGAIQLNYQDIQRFDEPILTGN